ncbi:MAG: glutathione S-transferase N-terminal domain-containing protein [Myxococcota bacterium]
MPAQSRLAIEDQYPIRDWDKLQLFSLNTPNGVKVGVALEELGLEYEPHQVNIGDGEQKTAAFLEINPNGKIPVLIDPHGPGGRRLVLMESGAILLHLSEITGRLMPTDPLERAACLQWLFFQVGHVGPMFGQLGHFHRIGRKKTEDTYALERYTAETRRLLDILETRLTSREFIVGDAYSIADIAIFPWVRTLIGFYDAAEQVGFADFPRVGAWLEGLLARPQVQAGIKVTGDR